MTDSDLSSLSRSLGELGSETAVKNVQKAVEQTAGRVKNTWNAKLYRDGHAARTGRSISYDVGVGHAFALFATDVGDVTSSTIIAEIGPRTGSGKQAGIVRLLENGSVHNAPHGYGAAALAEHEADFEQAIDFAIWAAAQGAGLG